MSPFNPAKYWANTIELTVLLAEAQVVIAMRMLGMAGLWSVPRSEDARMVSEKVSALTKSSAEATRAAVRGASADQIVAAALRPVRQKTRANSRRLAKRGPKTG